jgi:cyclopropane fatty-acyl-phospholipid synthase-like methyltransferase
MTTGFDYFDRMYRVPDPWSFESSAYERRKYAMTLASLPRPRYRRAFEPGCSIGILSEQLARRTDELVAVDLHPSPVARAEERLAGLDGARVQRLDIPTEWPSGTFDLIVLSEIAYYFGPEDHERLMGRVRASLDPGGDLVLVHWRGTTDYPSTGDEVHERWRQEPHFVSVDEHCEDLFRLDVLRATGATTPTGSSTESSVDSSTGSPSGPGPG